MATTSLVTVKRLFAVSGNRCSFPKCRQPLVEGNTVIGEICHIKANSPNGPRYDTAQSDEERNCFDNLIMLCSIHHKVIDSDEDSYTVDRLHAMKNQHEASATSSAEIDDSTARQFILQIGSVSIQTRHMTVSNGGNVVNVTSYNQSGGQTAHTINNLSPPQREMPVEIRQLILNHLSQHPQGKIGFASTQGDAEAHGYKNKLMALFNTAGWDVEDMSTFMIFEFQRGLVLKIPLGASEAGTPQVVAHALSLTGEPISCRYSVMANSCQHLVQVWGA